MPKKSKKPVRKRKRNFSEAGPIHDAHDKIIYNPLPNDVKCGQDDRALRDNAGNNIFKKQIKETALKYKLVKTNKEKRLLCLQLIKDMKETYKSRFIKLLNPSYPEEHQVWVEIHNRDVRNKVTHAIRYYIKRQKMNTSQRKNTAPNAQPQTPNTEKSNSVSCYPCSTSKKDVATTVDMTDSKPAAVTTTTTTPTSHNDILTLLGKININENNNKTHDKVKNNNSNNDEDVTQQTIRLYGRQQEIYHRMMVERKLLKPDSIAGETNSESFVVSQDHVVLSKNYHQPNEPTDHDESNNSIKATTVVQNRVARKQDVIDDTTGPVEFDSIADFSLQSIFNSSISNNNMWDNLNVTIDTILDIQYQVEGHARCPPPCTNTDHNHDNDDLVAANNSCGMKYDDNDNSQGASVSFATGSRFVADPITSLYHKSIDTFDLLLDNEPTTTSCTYSESSSRSRSSLSDNNDDDDDDDDEINDLLKRF